jgi:hypothetical protein
MTSGPLATVLGAAPGRYSALVIDRRRVPRLYLSFAVLTVFGPLALILD